MDSLDEQSFSSFGKNSFLCLELKIYLRFCAETSEIHGKLMVNFGKGCRQIVCLCVP